jgi:small subunit ribosomal protein S16
MLGIRLKRTGRTNDPSFKIVVGERKYSPKSGKHFEYLGSYNPKTKNFIVNAEAVKGWIAKGAQLSDTVHNLFLSKGIIEGKKINVLPAFKAPAPTSEAVGAPTESVGEIAEAPAKEEPKAE